MGKEWSPIFLVDERIWRYGSRDCLMKVHINRMAPLLGFHDIILLCCQFNYVS